MKKKYTPNKTGYFAKKRRDIKTYNSPSTCFRTKTKSTASMFMPAQCAE